MKRISTWGLGVLGALALASVCPSRAVAQDPILTPIIASEAAPIVVQALTPKPKPGVQKFQGYIVNANNAQVTLKARGNDMTIQTFSLSQTASAKMQKIVDNGGYQYGDKVTVYYDTQTRQALKFKGKPSRPL
jgi:hypothetical protein